MMMLSYTIFIFMYYYNGTVGMKLCVILINSQCKFSDTQVTIKASGPLDLDCYNSFFSQKANGYCDREHRLFYFPPAHTERDSHNTHTYCYLHECALGLQDVKLL